MGTFCILLYSLFIDIFWCLFWGGKWDTVPTIAHELTVFLSWVGIVIKVIVFIIIGLLEWDSLKNSLIRLLKKQNTGKGFVPYTDEI